MRQNPDIDELLNSFIDGELTAGQKTEIERLITRNENIAQRLRQLQKCKMLMGSLPRAEAPVSILEGIKASLDGRTMPAERQVTSHVRAVKRHLPARRVLSTAAMIGLVAVLTAVIYTTVGPETVPDVAEPIEPRAGVVATSGFSGRLELRTSALVAVDAFINSVIEDSGLSAPVVPTRRQDKRIYSLNCSREDLNLLLVNLEYIWDELDLATLFVNTEEFGRPVAVEAVTTEQISEIVDQDSPERRVKVAKDFAALNSIAEYLPGKEVMAAIDDGDRSLITIPKPVLTGPQKTAEKPSGQAQGAKMVHLTIVVDW